MSAMQTTLENPEVRRISQRRNVVLAMYGMSAFGGIAQGLAPDNALLYYLSALSFSSLATMWFAIDRRLLARPTLSVMYLLFFLTWPLAALIHLLITRGVRGLGYWLIHAVGLIATLCLTFYPTVFLRYGPVIFGQD